MSPKHNKNSGTIPVIKNKIQNKKGIINQVPENIEEAKKAMKGKRRKEEKLNRAAKASV